MALRMPRPVRRRDTSFLSFRARVPADIVDATKGQAIALAFPAEAGEPEHVALVRPGREVKFSLRIRNPAVAKSRRGIALAQLETRWNAIRSGPKPLTHRQIIRYRARCAGRSGRLQPGVPGAGCGHFAVGPSGDA